ncbi:hypothetical protein K6119_03445 [Paracrocinitomix mangrovi]|uniref:hypothetical protein n=1 Tax=Paracrocinitomix mangrovi TaxID=2862509 RepID=UPI001C8D518B|nr:hypothetical protein [Paracrocinitomix mangrovi]UKN02570.1 hypothetical protein K6119_03445 [Paracrocinitomix mangrovi]
MKKTLLVAFTLLAGVAIGQKAVIVEEGGMFGLQTDFGKELLPKEYVKITKVSTDTLDFYIAEMKGAAELYSYSNTKRDIFEESAGQNYTVIKSEWVAAKKGNDFFGYTSIGEKFRFAGENWEAVKVKGMIACKDESGKFAVCMAGKALSPYIYNAVDARHRELAVCKTDTGWIALDEKMKSHYNWSFDEIMDNDVSSTAYVIKKGDKYGILSLDESMNLPPSIVKNAPAMFSFDGKSYADLNRNYAVQRDGKWGVVNQKNETQVPFKYDNAYMIDKFSIEQHSLTVRVVVKEGANWHFLDEKGKVSKTVQFDEWVGTQGDVAFVIKGGKVEQLSLTNFGTQSNLFFGEYDDYKIVTNDDRKVGVVGKNGDIIMPFEFDVIFVEGKNYDFFMAEKKGKDGIYALDGKNLVPHNYEGLMYLTTKNEKDYFTVGRRGEAALAYWDRATNKMTILSERKYLDVSYDFKTKNFKAKLDDGKYHQLDDNGKLLEGK